MERFVTSAVRVIVPPTATEAGVANQETARARLFHDVLFVTVNTVPELHEVVLSRAARDAVRSESVVTSADAEAMPAPDGPVSAILNISMPLLVMPAVEVVKQTVLAVVDCIAQPLGAATDAAILYTEEFTANCTALMVDDELDVFVTRNTIVSEVFPIVTTLRATFSNWTVVAAKAVFAEKKRNNAKLEVKRGRQSFLSAVLNPPSPPFNKGGNGGIFPISISGGCDCGVFICLCRQSFVKVSYEESILFISVPPFVCV